MRIVVLDPAWGNIRSEVETSVLMKLEAVEAKARAQRQTLPWKFRAALFPAGVRGDVSGQRRYLFAVTPHDSPPLLKLPLWVDLLVEK